MEAGAVQDISAIPDMGALVLKTGGMLLVVLAVLMGVVFLLKRIGGMRQLAGQGAVAVRGTYHLGPKERLMLVDVEGVRLLLGVTPAGISTLHTFGEVEAIADADEASPSFFETLLRRRMARGEAKQGEAPDET